MPNELAQGTRRVGQLIDGDPETPHIDVVLRHESNGIFVDVPWNPTSSAYGEWFGAEDFTIGKSETRDLPKVLNFRDSNGSVFLLGCQQAGYTTNYSSGLGKIHVEYAVLGPRDMAYEFVHRLRWEVSGLRRWMGRSSITTRRFTDNRHRTEVVIEPAERFEIPGRNDIAFIPTTWWRHASEDVQEAHDLLWVETITEEPSRWNSHAAVPRMLRDLLAVSHWSEETYELRSASRDEDVIENMSTNEVLGRNWRKVVAGSSEDNSDPRPYEFNPRELIRFEDIGLEGLLRWFDLSEKYGRVIDPIVSQTIVREAHPLARLSHAGPAVEALGYFLHLEDGMEEGKAARVPLRARVERIAAELDGVLPFDVNAWAQAFPDVYNGVKHANRAEQKHVDVMNSWGQSVMAVRSWIALRLGVTREDLKQRLAQDRQPYEFVEVEQA